MKYKYLIINVLFIILLNFSCGNNDPDKKDEIKESLQDIFKNGKIKKDKPIKGVTSNFSQSEKKPYQKNKNQYSSENVSDDIHDKFESNLEDERKGYDKKSSEINYSSKNSGELINRRISYDLDQNTKGNLDENFNSIFDNQQNIKSNLSYDKEIEFENNLFEAFKKQIPNKSLKELISSKFKSQYESFTYEQQRKLKDIFDKKLKIEIEKEINNLNINESITKKDLENIEKIIKGFKSKKGYISNYNLKNSFKEKLKQKLNHTEDIKILNDLIKVIGSFDYRIKYDIKRYLENMVPKYISNIRNIDDLLKIETDKIDYDIKKKIKSKANDFINNNIDNLTLNECIKLANNKFFYRVITCNYFLNEKFNNRFKTLFENKLKSKKTINELINFLESDNIKKVLDNYYLNNTVEMDIKNIFIDKIQNDKSITSIDKILELENNKYIKDLRYNYNFKKNFNVLKKNVLESNIRNIKNIEKLLEYKEKIKWWDSNIKKSLDTRIDTIISKYLINANISKLNNIKEKYYLILKYTQISKITKLINEKLSKAKAKIKDNESKKEYEKIKSLKSIYEIINYISSDKFDRYNSLQIYAIKKRLSEIIESLTNPIREHQNILNKRSPYNKFKIYKYYRSSYLKIGISLNMIEDILKLSENVDKAAKNFSINELENYHKNLKEYEAKYDYTKKIKKLLESKKLESINKLGIKELIDDIIKLEAKYKRYSKEYKNRLDALYNKKDEFETYLENIINIKDFIKLTDQLKDAFYFNNKFLKIVNKVVNKKQTEIENYKNAGYFKNRYENKPRKILENYDYLDIYNEAEQKYILKNLDSAKKEIDKEYNDKYLRKKSNGIFDLIKFYNDLLYKYEYSYYISQSEKSIINKYINKLKNEVEAKENVIIDKYKKLKINDFISFGLKNYNFRIDQIFTEFISKNDYKGSYIYIDNYYNTVFNDRINEIKALKKAEFKKEISTKLNNNNLKNFFINYYALRFAVPNFWQKCEKGSSFNNYSPWHINNGEISKFLKGMDGDIDLLKQAAIDAIKERNLKNLSINDIVQIIDNALNSVNNWEEIMHHQRYGYWDTKNFLKHNTFVYLSNIYEILKATNNNNIYKFKEILTKKIKEKVGRLYKNRIQFEYYYLFKFAGKAYYHSLYSYYNTSYGDTINNSSFLLKSQLTLLIDNETPQIYVDLLNDLSNEGTKEERILKNEAWSEAAKKAFGGQAPKQEKAQKKEEEQINKTKAFTRKEAKQLKKTYNLLVDLDRFRNKFQESMKSKEKENQNNTDYRVNLVLRSIIEDKRLNLIGEEDIATKIVNKIIANSVSRFITKLGTFPAEPIQLKDNELDQNKKQPDMSYYEKLYELCLYFVKNKRSTRSGEINILIKNIIEQIKVRMKDEKAYKGHILNDEFNKFLNIIKRDAGKNKEEIELVFQEIYSE